MPRNGSGTMSLIYDWTTDEAAAIDITASRFDTQEADIAAEITNSVAKDGQTTMTGNLKMGSQKITGLSDGTDPTDAPSLRQAQSGAAAYVVDSGSANTYVVAPSPAYTAYVTGMTVKAKAANANTGASTLNVNSLGAKDLKKSGGSALAAGDITANSIFHATYNGTDFEMLPVVSAGNLILISTATASSSATIDFTGLTSTYKTYVLYFDGLVPATDGAEINFRISTDNGSTYKSGASDYKYAGIRVTTESSAITSRPTSDAHSHILICNSVGNASGESASGTIVMNSLSSASLYCLIQSDTTSVASSGFLIQERTGSSYVGATTAIDAIRVLMSSGNIASGNFRLYGVKG